MNSNAAVPQIIRVIRDTLGGARRAVIGLHPCMWVTKRPLRATRSLHLDIEGTWQLAGLPRGPHA